MQRPQPQRFEDFIGLTTSIGQLDVHRKILARCPTSHRTLDNSAARYYMISSRRRQTCVLSDQVRCRVNNWVPMLESIGQFRSPEKPGQPSNSDHEGYTRESPPPARTSAASCPT